MTHPREDREHIACRAITDDDRESMIALLCQGFVSRTSAFWANALASLRLRTTPASCPRYGYCLTANGDIVGVLLLIYSSSDEAGGGLRCNVSSWCVRPEYRIYAPTLVKMASRKVDCTYINTSSEPHTRQGLLAQGYSCYAEGQFISVPALRIRRSDATVKRIRTRADAAEGGHAQLLADHAEHGCISLTCTREGRTYPFVFLKRRIPRTNLPCAQLVFCEDIESYMELHDTIGRYLLTLGLVIVMSDANGPLSGVMGLYFSRKMPKYYLGKVPPRLGDLSYTEDILFSIATR